MESEQPQNEKEAGPSGDESNQSDPKDEAAVADNEAAEKEKQSQDDEAVPGPSNGTPQSTLGESSGSSSAVDQKRKRERCDDDVSGSEECKRREDEGGRAEDADNPAERSETNLEACPFPRLRVRTCHRRYRRRLNNRSSSSSSDSSLSSSDDERPHDAVSSSSPAGGHPDDLDSSDGSLNEDRMLQILRRQALAGRFSLDSDDTWSLLDSDDSDSDARAGTGEAGKEPKEEDKKYHNCLSKEIPKHKWSVTKAVLNRQLGLRTQQQEPDLFWQHCYGSLHCVKRLELMYKLNEHHGCVNAISFNQSGTRLASGSDDKKIIIWDWPVGKPLVSYSSGHSSNVFQAKFLPLAGDNHVVSSARDGQVRLAVLSSTGECHGTKRLAHHHKPVNKLSLLPETPHVFLSAGEDGRVMSIDVRSNKPSTLVTVKNISKKIGLYGVDTHPLNNNEFCVCGLDYYIRIYDKRKIDVNGGPMKKFCPSHIHGTRKYTNVTCALYNHDGTEIVGSYNDESLYLFDTRHPDGADFVHKYEGHRNSATVKSCDFFGPNSEYIMSGSDCGNIFFWDKNTEAIVQFMRGDEKGVVNALVGHPQFPILATSGLDSDVKIWVPSCEQDPEMKELKKVVSKNLQDRVGDQPFRIDVLESHFTRDLRRQLGEGDTHGFPASLRSLFTTGAQGSTSSDNSDSDSYGGAQPIQCPPS